MMSLSRHQVLGHLPSSWSRRKRALPDFVNYRQLNCVTKDSYPLPRIDDTLADNTWFSTLDIKSGYWQAEIHPEDKEKTAFTMGQGL
ncbi:retrovirus-related Pol polyprotein from transposon 297 [Trichonephila clavipes]|nr:retrovirus-related Pol polyprotein from transposon 297 [Trichonephila clavipes]